MTTPPSAPRTSTSIHIVDTPDELAILNDYDSYLLKPSF